MGIARAPITAPSSAPEPVISYTTQPSAACWIHWLDHDRSELVHSQRKSRYASADGSSAPRGCWRCGVHVGVVPGQYADIDHTDRAAFDVLDGFCDSGLQVRQF